MKNQFVKLAAVKLELETTHARALQFDDMSGLGVIVGKRLLKEIAAAAWLRSMPLDVDIKFLSWKEKDCSLRKQEVE
uniref:Uncharacterized protein n=1 Tax=Oryza barthii TaxID=65489 RepID=A0A0D3FUM5_9ORYZ